MLGFIRRSLFPVPHSRSALRLRFGLPPLLGVLALAGCATAPLAHVPGSPTKTVTVIGRGWHTELGLPVRELTPPLATVARRFPGAVVLTFGFGDRAFVLGRDSRFTNALGALFPSPGLILVTALNTSATAAFDPEYVVTLHVSRQGFDRIAGFVWRSIAHRHDHPPLPYGPGPYPGTLYYASTVTYDAFNTCNTWAASALRSGGVPVQASGVVFASQLMREVRRVAATEKPHAPQQGGARPLGHAVGAGTAAGGTTTVVPGFGGGGLLLLNVTQPPSTRGAKRNRRGQRNARITSLRESSPPVE